MGGQLARRRPARSGERGRASQIASLALVATSLVAPAALATSHGHKKSHDEKKHASKARDAEPGVVETTPFAEKNGSLPYNASGVVQVGPSRFVFVDNNDPTALFELELSDDGAQRGPIRRRPLVGLAPGALADPEGLARVDAGGATWLVVASSFGAKVDKKSGEVTARDGLVRVRYEPEGELRAEAMPGFRAWLLAREPSLASAATREPDQDGLNVEGLAWDPSRGALLFGLRSPVEAGRLTIVPVKVKVDGPWTASALAAEPAIRVAVAKAGAVQGVRDLSYDAETHRLLVLLGRSLSGADAPFELYAWDGASATASAVPGVAFSPKAKPEGVTVASIGGKRKLLVVDDRGGFAVLTP